MVIILKKKVLSVVLLSALLASSASASTINGEYKGNPIVKIRNNGQELPVEDAPAILYGDRTMVPLYMLKNIGIDVKWNDSDYSVDVKNTETKGFTIDDLIRMYGPESKKNLINYAEYMTNGKGFSQVNIVINFDTSKNSNDFQMLMIVASAIEVSQIRIEDTSNYIKFIKPSDFRSFFKGEITVEEFVNKIEFVAKTVSSSQQQTTTPEVSNLNAIESKIDGDFEGFEEGKIFKLQNGQIWEQTDFTYKYVYKYSPAVLIYKDGVNYMMSVSGVDKKVKVKQLK